MVISKWSNLALFFLFIKKVVSDTVLNNQTSNVLLLFCRHKTNQENLLIFNYLFQFLLNILTFKLKDEKNKSNFDCTMENASRILQYFDREVNFYRKFSRNGY